MSIQLIGIENENEFYPAGFFSGALEGELTEIISRWAEENGSSSPIQRLESCANEYREMVERVRSMPDDERIVELRRNATHALITALGYPYARHGLETCLDGETLVPSIARIADADGRDVIWVLEAPIPDQEDWSADPLSMAFRGDQCSGEEAEFAETAESIEDILGKGIFTLKAPPRYVIVLGLSQLVLVDRLKWLSRSVLRFDLHEIFSRNEKETLNATACFLAREARAPESGVPLADRLEEEAQRHANAVTSSLKKTVRDAIEILGQEVLDVTQGKYPAGPRRGTWIDGKDLSLECLRYMYRLLFLFYAEANTKLGVLDLKDPVYATGYSLEALRELESVRLRSSADRNGTYLWNSLQRLLSLMYEGNDQVFRLRAVKVSLLDPEATPILSRIQLRNEAVQKIIRLLSLKKSKSGMARISYAQLGIGQLGAVYETLISFTGFVAKVDLIELRPQTGRGGSDTDEEAEDQEDDDADDDDEAETEAEEEEVDARTDKVDLLAPSYFVPRSRAPEFKPEEIVYAGPEPRVYPKGTFVYRLAGRDREKSASYYTPEPLARLLVKHALMERCKDLTADEILELKILEPAMGSAAFLVETTNQLADLYLVRKQKEIGRTIPQEDYFLERQKVRAFISDRNCFGVDLNPVAVELGAISLWLNSLHNSDFSPWFGDQLHAGNSLIGARRASYAPNLMTANKKGDLWFNFKPQEIGWKGTRPEGHIWQFLLPAKDMVKFDTDKSIAEFAGEAQQTIKDWRKGGFFDKLQPHEVKLLQKLSGIADALFEIVASDLAKSRAASNDAITLWPDKVMPGVTGEGFRDKERRIRRLMGADHASNTLPYKRLETAMDAWCALWLWPLDKADLLPNRTEFLHGMAMILEGGFMPDGSLAAPSMAEFTDPSPNFLYELEPDAPATDLFVAAKKNRENLFRETDVDSLVEEVDWLGVAAEVAARARFTHFDLIFADVLKTRDGFDLIVGNPPWARLGFNETDAIGDIDPGFVTRNLSAFETRNVRATALTRASDRVAYLHAYVSAKGAMAVTASEAMNPFAGAGRNNLYRCFIDLSFRLVASKGYAALIHQDGHLTDPKSGAFRREWYARIAKHFEFINRMKTKNFTEVDHNVRFSLNIYRGHVSEINIEKVTNAFVASQVEDSYRHDGLGTLPAIKNEEGNWDTRGHSDRIVHVDHGALAAIHALTEDNTIPVEEARFLQPYSAKMLDVFRAMAAAPSLADSVEPITRTVSTPQGEHRVEIPGWQMNSVWNEVSAQRELKVIRRETRFHHEPAGMIISGPMFHVGNPFYKTPKAACRTNADYQVVDLTTAPDDYLPRTNYAPAVETSEYRRQLPSCRWDPTKSHVDFYRVAFRNMINLNSERSLIGALAPPGFAHIHTVESVGFARLAQVAILNALSVSLVFDFLIKASGRGHLFGTDVAAFSFINPGETAIHRALRLACLTTAYAHLWNDQASVLTPQRWHSRDPRLTLEGPEEGPAIWDRTAALRTEFARRMALVEIDVLVAQALGLTLDQLIDIYLIYFPVLQQNEAGTWYDQNGRIAWTCSKGLPGVGFLEDGKSPSRKRWDQVVQSGQIHLTCEAIEDFRPGGPRVVTRSFEGPFDTCRRVEDYARAWTYFEAHKAKEEAA
jgi:hypothetical protein